MNLQNLNDYGIKTNKSNRNILVVVDNFSKCNWTVTLKNTNAETVKDLLGINLNSSKRKPNLIEADDEEEFFNKVVLLLLKIRK